MAAGVYFAHNSCDLRIHCLCSRFAGNLVLKLVYGYTATDEDDHIVKLVDEAMDQFSEMVVTNAFLVDALPVRESHSSHYLLSFLYTCLS
jgi:tRNA G10  N-methylase Trm11